MDSLAALVGDLLDVMPAGQVRPSRASPRIPPRRSPRRSTSWRLGPTAVRLALAHDEHTAEADPVLLKRALVNLLANAAPLLST